MQNEIKTLNGIMNLDDSNEVMPSTHHKEARNGVFKGNAPEMHFTAIRGNSKVNNTSLIADDCRISGSALFTPNCNLQGTAQYIGKCELAGEAILQVNFTITSSCILNDGKIIIGGITGGSGTYEIGNLAYATEAIALASTGFAEATSKTFNNMPDGTLWYVVRDKNNPSNKIAKSATISCDGTSTECRSSVTVTIGAGGSEVFYQDCCGTARSVSYTAAGSYTITDCIKGGSLSSPDNGFLSFSYGTTTCNCVNFALTYNCGEGTGDSTVEAKTFTGGGGTYQISSILHTSAANASAGTFVDVSTTTVKYNTVPDGTWYISLRDKTNTLNKITKSIVSDCVIAGECSCYTIVNTTATAKNIAFFACNGNTTSLSIPGNSTKWICVANGTVPPAVTGLTITKCSPTVSCETNVSCFECGSTDPVWSDQNYNVCIDCVSYDVYKDINPNSESAGKFKVNGVIDTIEPAESTCNITADYSEEVGTYYRCSAGTTIADTVYKNTNPCFVGNQYKAGTVTYATNPKNTIPDTEPILTDQGYYTCYQCADRLVYKNTNECSPFYNYYYVNGDRLTTTAPPAGLCPTTSNWVDLEFKTCYGCEELQVYQNQQACVTNSYKYRIGGAGGVVVDERPSNTLCNYAANWVLTGYNTCSGCANYPVYRDTNGCSATYNQYRVNNVVVGSTEPTRGNCSTTADWQNFGARVCIDCTSYQPQKDMNPCSSTANNIRNVDGVYGAAPCNTTDPSYTSAAGTVHYCTNGTVNTAPVMANTNACYSSMNTAQFRVDFGGGNYLYYGTGANPANAYPDTTALWINRPIDQNWVCIGNVRYYEQIDINTCSPTAGQTRTGDMDGIVAGYCGYNPVVCTNYEIVNSDSNYDLYVNYTACGGGAASDTVGGGGTITICAEEDSVSLGGSGSVTDIGSCSV